MEFFKNHHFGDDEDEDLVEKKVREGASLEELFLIPNLLDELSFQNEVLIEYLKQPLQIERMIFYLRVLGDPEQYSENRCYHYPYFSYEVLSSCNENISFNTISNDEHLLNLFGVASRFNDPNFDTCFGYIQGVVQNLISQNNTHNKDLVDKIRERPGDFVYPFVAVMNKSSSEFLFDIIGYIEDGFGGFKEELFKNLIEIYFEFSAKYRGFEKIEDEIAFWTEIFKRKGIESRLILGV